jgi:hypothetical protein
VKPCKEQLYSESREAANKPWALKNKAEWLRKMASVSIKEWAAVTEGGGAWPGCRTCAEHITRVLKKVRSSLEEEGAALDRIIKVVGDTKDEYHWDQLFRGYDDDDVRMALEGETDLAWSRMEETLKTMSQLSHWSEVVANVEHAHRILQRQWDKNGK